VSFTRVRGRELIRLPRSRRCPFREKRSKKREKRGRRPSFSFTVLKRKESVHYENKLPEGIRLCPHAGRRKSRDRPKGICCRDRKYAESKGGKKRGHHHGVSGRRGRRGEKTTTRRENRSKKESQPSCPKTGKEKKRGASNCVREERRGKGVYLERRKIDAVATFEMPKRESNAVPMQSKNKTGKKKKKTQVRSLPSCKRRGTHSKKKKHGGAFSARKKPRDTERSRPIPRC